VTIQDFVIHSNTKIAENTFLIGIEKNNFSEELLPGQFFNIQVSNSTLPLLRRPFSICDVSDDTIFFMYKVVGEGTLILSQKVKGEKLNLLGPLGNTFKINSDFDRAILIGGGIGIAPFPFLIKKLENKKVDVLFGVRSKNEIHNYGLVNVKYSSDDGSVGMKGNVIDLLENELNNSDDKIKIFACGPNAMFRALKKYLLNKNNECEVSMESAMACGFGICQGCPIEHKDSETYKLICKDGPIFNIRDITI
jgi:dihydroorotate dehydrogenase electron transfer subunit